MGHPRLLLRKESSAQFIKLGAWLGVTEGTNREDKVNFCVLFTLSELQDESKSYKQLILKKHYNVLN